MACPAISFNVCTRDTASTNIRVNRDLGHTTPHSISSMKKQTGVYFLMRAWRKTRRVMWDAVECIDTLGSDQQYCFSPVLTDVTDCARNPNNSCLFFSSRRKAFQLRGNLLSGATRCRTPDPRFHQIVAFKLFSTYSSQTRSIRFTWRSSAVISGTNVPDV